MSQWSIYAACEDRLLLCDGNQPRHAPAAKKNDNTVMKKKTFMWSSLPCFLTFVVLLSLHHVAFLMLSIEKPLHIFFLVIPILWKMIPVGGCILNCFMWQSLPCFLLPFCCSAIPTSGKLKSIYYFPEIWFRWRVNWFRWRRYCTVTHSVPHCWGAWVTELC